MGFSSGLGVTHLDILGQAAGHVGGQLVADDGTLLEGQQDRRETLGAAAQQGRVPGAALWVSTAVSQPRPGRPTDPQHHQGLL